MQSPLSLDDVVLRSMTSVDVQHVRELHQTLLPLVQYPSSFFLQLLIVPGRHCIVAVDRANPSTPIAFLSAVVHDAPNTEYRGDREELDYLVDEFLGRESSKYGKVIPRRKGGSGIYCQRDDDTRVPRLELLTLGVEPEYQHGGLARLLVQEMVRRVQSSFPDAFDIKSSMTGLSPPSPLTPDTPSSPDGHKMYFEPGDVNSHLKSKSLITYANVSTTNIQAIDFYKHIGLSVLPNVKLAGVYNGQGSRLMKRGRSSGCNGQLHTDKDGFVASGNGRDAYIVVGLL